jgi:hypothetical protein
MQAGVARYQPLRVGSATTSQKNEATQMVKDKQ